MVAFRLRISLLGLLAALLAARPVRGDKPSAEEPVRRNAQEDLPTGALVRLGMQGQGPRGRSSGHSCRVRQLAFSPDGKSLVSSAYSPLLTVPECDRGLLLWDVERAEVRGRFGAEWGMVMGLAFSADGALLAVGADDRAIHLWSPRTHKEVRTLRDCTWTPSCLRWSADGKSLLFRGYRNIFVRDASGGPEQLLSKQGGIAALSQDGSLAAVDSLFDARIHAFSGVVVETATGKQVLSYGEGRAQAFSADGKLLAVTTREEIVVWDLPAKKKEVAIPIRSEILLFLRLRFTAD